MTVEEVLRKVKELCEAHGASEVILYGSSAKGTELERSDIDIAVAGAHEFSALEEEAEEIPTLYTVDLLDLDACRNELLLEDIRKYGRKI